MKSLPVAELDLQQACYEASLAERRYAACDPDNRLIAAELERSWETSLRRVQACEARLEAMRSPDPQTATPDLDGLADDLKAAWNAPGVSMRSRQRLVRTLISGIVADVDEEARDINLTIHWQGGLHSQLRVRKPRSGEHGCRTPEEALAVIRSMAGRWSDEHIAASLNRMGMRTGQDKSWTANRVGSIRRVNGIDGYLSADKHGDWRTMAEMERYRPRNSFPERLGRSEPRTSIQRASPTPWHRGKARVALRAGIRCQCFQTLEEGVQNDSIVAIPLSALSAALFVRQIRPSSRKRANSSQRRSI